MTTSFKIFFRTFFAIISICITIGFSACNDEIISTNPKYKISFSTDTLSFDTVFTSLGSATSKIWVYNRNSVALKISHLGIAGGKNSSFHINVDGSVNADNQFSDIEIGAHDSIFIFVAVTVDPKNSNSPVFIQDSILFETNGNNQNVKLQAFGQDMIVMRNKYILNDTTLNADKPYLVYGHLAIDTAKTLTLQAGTRIYFHNNANLVVYGNLKAEGTAENPILLRGDRLDKIKFVTPVPYNTVAGQWGGVYLLWNGGNHVLKHVNLNSGYVGLYYVNDNRNTLPNLEISNCRIHNFQLYGLVVQNGNVIVSNSEISNTSSYSVYLSGGKHTFIQSTIANYFNNSPNTVSRDKKPAVMIMDLDRIAPMESIFRNCVISGSSENEFSLASKFLGEYKGTFDHCYIRKTEPSKLAQFTNMHWYERNDTVFKSTNYDAEKGIYFNFALDSVSPARDIADPTLYFDSKYIKYHLEKDLNGNNRFEDGLPDAGAYEWQPTKK